MKKSILVCSLVLTGLSLSLVSCKDKPTTSAEVFTVKDVTVNQNQTVDIQFDTSDSSLTENVEYYFEGSNIRINGNQVTGLVDDTVTEVTAFSGDYEDTFTVTVLPNYGTLTVDDITLYAEGPGVAANPRFSNPKYKEDVIYTFTSDAIKEEDGVFYALKVNETVEVSAKTSHLETSFTVTTKEFTDYADAVRSRVTSWEEAGSPTGETLFIGDSFFDTQFWSNFYTTFGKYSARTFGISATTSTDWEYWLDDLVYPQNPKNLVMHIGTNNIYDDHKNAEQTITEVTRLIETIHNKLPDTKIYYFGIEPRTYGANGRSVADTITLLNEINTGIKSYIEDTENVTYLDSPALCYNTDGTVKSDFFRDGTHPKLENYDYYVDLLNEAGCVIDLNENLSRDIPDFTRTQADTVGQSQQMMYLGAPLSRNFILEGKFDLTGKGNNAHIEFRFGTDSNNRFLLWDNDNNNQFGLGWCDKGVYQNPTNQDYTFVNGETLTISYKIVASSKNVYFYINDVLLAIYVNIPDGTKDFYLGSESCDIKFYDLKAVTLVDDKDEYKNAFDTLNLDKYENMTGKEGVVIGHKSSSMIARPSDIDTESYIDPSSTFNISGADNGAGGIYTGIRDNVVVYNGLTLLTGDWKVSYDVQILNSDFEPIETPSDAALGSGNYFFYYGVSTAENEPKMWERLQLWWRKTESTVKIGTQLGGTDFGLGLTGYENDSFTDTSFHIELEREGGEVFYTINIGDASAKATLTIDANTPLSIRFGAENLNAQISNFHFTLVE